MEHVEVVTAVGRFEDAATLVGTSRPDAGACWCMSYRDARLANAERPAALRDLCSVPPGPGVLAYVDGEPAGWCSVAPRSSYRRLVRSRTIPTLDDRDAWAVVCFVVRPGYRRRGLLHELLDGAVAHARAHGAEVVEGYPVDAADGRVDSVAGYVGSVQLFERAGFVRVSATTAHSARRVRWVVRRELGT
ncbi:GNAT family N-acetyltransferase [Aquipuribacter sp. SD81]|uniref:GNAT family N-acetyltransferase n=1 Tax=Aquipuribacter sp. SD81 TaxID=3127703 RepID=UPI00301709FE